MSAITNTLPSLPSGSPAVSTTASTMPASFSAPSPAASVAPSTHQPPTALGLFDLHPAADAPENELLRHRFLSRQGSLLIVGNTGIGKSSLTMQMMIHWALGRGCFDMLPARPLKSLLVQGENDFEDLAEMRDGVVGGMGLNDEQRATINHRILISIVASSLPRRCWSRCWLSIDLIWSGSIRCCNTSAAMATSRKLWGSSCANSWAC